jgi:hypothetical protein
MDTATVVDMGRQALWMTMLISAPLLLVGLFSSRHLDQRANLELYPQALSDWFDGCRFRWLDDQQFGRLHQNFVWSHSRFVWLSADEH